MNGEHENDVHIARRIFIGNLSHDIMAVCESMREVRTGDLLKYELWFELYKFVALKWWLVTPNVTAIYSPYK